VLGGRENESWDTGIAFRRSVGAVGRPRWCRPDAGSPSEKIRWYVAVLDGFGIAFLLTRVTYASHCNVGECLLAPGLLSFVLFCTSPKFGGQITEL
jgi:hypothetical protein